MISFSKRGDFDDDSSYVHSDQLSSEGANADKTYAPSHFLVNMTILLLMMKGCIGC